MAVASPSCGQHHHRTTTRYPVAYRRIVAAVKTVVPEFDSFVFEPQRLNPRNIALNWRARGSDYDFGVHQLSDGSLRFIALATLFFQPPDDLPRVVVVDEPELGLHPHAIATLADMVRVAADHCQVVLATQSATLLDAFDPADVITTSLRNGATTFARLDADGLRSWLDEYTLSDLWQRGVIAGGRPA